MYQNISTTPSSHHNGMSSVWKIILYVAYSTIFFIGTTGNARVIIYLVSKRRKKLHHGHGFIVALACTDFLSSIFMPFVMINDIATDYIWHFGELWCAVLPAISSVMLSVSAWILVAISWERKR